MSGYLEKDFQRSYWESNTNARSYDHPVVRYFVQQRIAYLSKRLDLGAVESAFEVGCGDGFATFHLGQVLPRVDGGDISMLMLDSNPVARGRLAVIDAENLPLCDSSYDMVYTWEVLHHMPRPEVVVREMARVAREWVVIFEPNRNNPLQFLFGALVKEERGTLRSTRKYLAELCAQADLDVVAVDYCGKIPPNKTPEALLPVMRRIPFEGNALTGISIAVIARKRNVSP